MKINGNPDGGGGASAVIEGLSVTSNGTYTAGEGVDGYSPVEVNVPAPEFVTETLSVSVNNTYYPGQGVDGFSQVIVDVPQSVTGFTEKDYTEHTFHFVDLNNSASFVYNEKFYDETELRTVYLPECKEVRSSAFMKCINLSSISLPVCESIGSYAFASTGLISVYLPEVTYLGVLAFNSCSSLTTVELPKLSSTKGGNFQYCSSLTSISFPKLEFIEADVFTNCSALQYVDMPNVSVISSRAFQNCNSLQSLNFPKCKYILDEVFRYCSNLTYVDLPCLFMGGSVFTQCSNLTTVNLPYCLSVSGGTFWNCRSLTSLSLPLCICGSLGIGYTNLSIIDLPLYAGYMGDYQWAASTVEKLNMPVQYSRLGNMGWSNLKELSLGNRTYNVPPYPAGISNILNGGSIYVDAAMWDQWLSATGWSSLSAAFVSFGDANEPMISVNDGTMTGKTWIFHGGNYFGVNVIDLSQCKRWEQTYGGNFSSVTSINLPECKVFEGISGMYHLQTVNLPKCEVIYAHTTICYDCGSSVSMYIGSGLSTLCKLIPMYQYNITLDSRVKIYVPSSFADAYKSAPYWSWYSSQIFPIE